VIRNSDPPPRLVSAQHQHKQALARLGTHSHRSREETRMNRTQKLRVLTTTLVVVRA
jgi:hypothetical protein